MHQYQKILPILAVLIIAVTACQKNSINQDSTALPIDKVQSASGAALRVPCSFTADSSTLSSRIGIGPSYVYQRWTKASWTAPGSTGPLVLQFEGPYASFVRPQPTSFQGWYIGLADTTVVCGDFEDWDHLITVKNFSPNVGTDPSTSDSAYIDGPYNVVGVNGAQNTPYKNYSFGTGYYGYVSQTPTILKAIVIWKISGATNPNSTAAAISPANATEAYVLIVDRFATTSTGTFTSKIHFRWRKVY